MGIKCCLNCPDRYVGCHSSCEKYKKERAEMDELNARIHKENHFRRYQQDKIGKRIIKDIKRKNKGWARYTHRD